jgi:molybdopterin-guanine dinucleotide biosynthesis protein A
MPDFRVGYDAVILAGGAASRLGGVDKAALELGGMTLLGHVLAATAGADRRIVVGPHRDGVAEGAGVGGGARVEWCREQPPGGGPVAGLAAGLDHATADLVVVLAADLPWVAPALAPLLAAMAGVEAAGGAEATETGSGEAVASKGGAGKAVAALLVDASGRLNYLVAVWRRAALLAAIRSIGPTEGASMRSLYSAVDVMTVPDEDGWGADCDTPADLAGARARFAAATTTTNDQ